MRQAGTRGRYSRELGERIFKPLVNVIAVSAAVQPILNPGYDKDFGQKRSIITNLRKPSGHDTLKRLRLYMY